MTVSSFVEQLFLDQDEALKELKVQLSRAQLKMKESTDEHRRDIQFVVGDLVYLKLRPYRLKSMAKHPFEKLSPRYYGQFEVESKVGQVAYKLKLPPTAAIHPVFHVSQLCKAKGNLQLVSSLPPQPLADGEFILEPESDLGVHPNSTNKAEGPDILIKWRSLPEYEATWEPFETIRLQFPNFHLEKKMDIGATGNDRPLIWFTYSRRKKKLAKSKEVS